MRILASADIHGNRAVYDWLLTAARLHSVDAILLAGDLLGFMDGFDNPRDAHSHEGQILVELLENFVAPVLYIMGNDDFVELNCTSQRVKSIHGCRKLLGSFNFVGYQYSLPFMGGVFEKDETEIEADLRTLIPLMDARTVFVSHSPAHGVLDPGFGERCIGSESLRAFLETNPFLAHIHGHSHGGFGRRGKHFNVAAAGQKRAMIINLNSMEHQTIGADLPKVGGTDIAG